MTERFDRTDLGVGSVGCGRMGTHRDETRGWLGHLSAGSPLQHTTPEGTRRDLESALAMEEPAASGAPLTIPQSQRPPCAEAVRPPTTRGAWT